MPMRRFQDIRLKRKLTLIMIGVMAASFVLSALIAVGYRYRSDRNAIEHHLSVLAGAIGANCSAALVFNDKAAASEILSALQADRSITCAMLTDDRSKPVASFGNCVGPDGTATAAHGRIRVDQRITVDGKTAGYLTIWGETSEVAERMANEAVVSITAFVLGVLVVLMVFERMLRLLNAPLLDLYETMRRVVRSRDYSIRATKLAEDEIGDVVVAFNQLMDQIESGAVASTPTPQPTGAAAPESSLETQPASFKS
jgi:methyl-accepting chemotaxis protein